MSRASKLFGNEPVINRVPDAVNLQGYPAFNLDIKEKYVKMLLTNTMGNTFYVKQKDLIKESEAIHTEMLASDPDFAAKALVYARNDGYMRLQPIYGLAMLSKVNVSLFKSIFNDIIRTPNDLFDFFAIRGSGGRAVKTAVSNWFATKMSQYWAIKYGANKGSKDSLDMKHALILFHPKGGNNDMYNYLMQRETNLSELDQIRIFEQLKKATSDDEKVRLISEGRIPHEVATSFAGNSKVVWSAIVPQMPVMALLKNLHAIEDHDAAESNKQFIVSTLSNPDIIAKSKILPYRFLEAEKHVSKSWIKDALRSALNLSFVNIPDIAGRTATFVDRSGSMRGNNMITAAIFGVAVTMKADDGRLITFDTSVNDVYVSKQDSLLTQAQRIQPGAATDTGLPFELITNEKAFYDTIVLITDGEQNRGTDAHIAFAKYRKEVNKNVKLFVIDISTGGVNLFDTNDKNIYFITGWSDQVLNYISIASKGWGTMIHDIETAE